MTREPITTEGAERLRNELNKLKHQDRPRITQDIAEARAHGDLSENAEYHAAREQQGMVEARIRRIESALAGAQIVDIRELEPDGRVVFGTTVGLLRISDDETYSYQIVGEIEADVERGRIALTTPMARAMIGKEEGDVIEIKTSDGTVEYEITSVLAK
ncbi:MAG: transcription elongation factor GreA [Candidatus Porifericomitaceae bacterium WSBS_2022_MAG_OTU9]